MKWEKGRESRARENWEIEERRKCVLSVETGLINDSFDFCKEKNKMVDIELRIVGMRKEMKEEKLEVETWKIRTQVEVNWAKEFW